jgi:hypothetical protein
MQAQAVYELSTCKPYEPDDARFTNAEFDVYREGYTVALVRALQVMRLAYERWLMLRGERRRRIALERASAAPSVEALRDRGGEELRVQVDDAADGIAQGPQHLDRDREAVGIPRRAVAGDEVHLVRTRSAVYVPFDDVGGDGFGHRFQSLERPHEGEPGEPREVVSQSESLDRTLNELHPGGALVHRHQVRAGMKSRGGNNAKPQRPKPR